MTDTWGLETDSVMGVARRHVLKYKPLLNQLVSDQIKFGRIRLKDGSVCKFPMILELVLALAWHTQDALRPPGVHFADMHLHDLHLGCNSQAPPETLQCALVDRAQREVQARHVPENKTLQPTLGLQHPTE